MRNTQRLHAFATLGAAVLFATLGRAQQPNSPSPTPAPVPSSTAPAAPFAGYTSQGAPATPSPTTTTSPPNYVAPSSLPPSTPGAAPSSPPATVAPPAYVAAPGLPPRAAAVPVAPASAQPAMPPAPATKSDAESGLGTQRVLALVAGGLGVTFVTVGIVAGLNARSDRDAARGHCTGAVCEDKEGIDLTTRAVNAGNLAIAA